MQVLFSLPLISNLVKEVDLARFSRNLYLLLSSGLAITAALDLTQDVVMRKDMRRVISDSQEMILAGKRLSDGMRKYKKLIPGIVIKLIEVGEKTGSLDKAMSDISVYLNNRVSSTLRTLLVLLEPVMLIGVAVFIGGMMVAIIAPIYGLVGQISAR